MPAAATILWFRSDLRLADHPALNAAVVRGGPVVPVFVLDEEAPDPWRPGGAARWWLHHSLEALAGDLRQRGAGLVLRRGRAEDVIPALARETGADAVYWSHLYEPWADARDRRVAAALEAHGIAAQGFTGRLLVSPRLPRTGAGAPFRVFKPFWKALLALGHPAAALPAPARIPTGPAPAGERLADWALTPRAPDWAGGLRATWTPGVAGAAARLDAFLADGLAGYDKARNRPDQAGTSRLSPHLRWGEVSPRQVWHAVSHRADAAGGEVAPAAMAFLRELGWREFSYHLLHWWPDLPERSWKRAFEDFPWADDPRARRAWTAGETGYPIVDAAMRELWHTGWMHNRCRMITASFLVKDLLVPWRTGENWFWDTLVDADLANNAASWQWVAGCGADAAPYFRVFNPVLQGRKFDPDGAYVRRWVPELARLPAAHVHAPWEAPAAVLADAGVRLGETYPGPVVDHQAARRRALAAFETIRKTAV